MPQVDGSGRKLSQEWIEVVRIENSSKVQCKHCEGELSCKVERIRQHLKNCKQFQQKQLRTDDGPIEVLDQDQDAGTGPSCAQTSSAPKRRQLSMKEFTVKTTKEQKDYLDKKVALFFYGNNIPFNVAQSTTFKEMIQAVRPGYEAPNAHKLGSTLLDQAASDVDENLKDKVKNSSLTLVLDGWSNVRNDPIMATSIHTGSTSFLLDVVDCGSEKKTARYCAEKAMKAIEKCELLLQKKIFAVCTDNENKMGRMRELLKEQRPDLITLGCSAHLMNLVEKDVTPRTVMSHIIEVQKYFRNVHQAHGWLREKNGMMPQIPNETRWNSHAACAHTYTLNYHLYVEIRTEHEREFDKNIARILDNVGIYREAVTLTSQLKIVAAALNKLQSDSTVLSDAVEIWLDILENDELSQYKECFQNRFKDAVQPFHYLANMMDPNKMGRRLTMQQKNSAEEWLADLHPDYLPAVLAFSIEDKEYYPSSMFHQSVRNKFTASKWWQILRSKISNSQNVNITADMCDFFWQLQSVPSSSASIERLFSTFGHVWSNLRNRLGAEKVYKLVKVYKALHEDVNSDNGY